MSLLTSRESECRTGGLNVLGSLCGLGFNFDAQAEALKRHPGFFRRHESLVSLAIWEAIYEIQSDWDLTNQVAAMTLNQLSAPRDSIQHFFRLKREGTALHHKLERTAPQIRPSPKYDDSTISRAGDFTPVKDAEDTSIKL